MICRPDQPAFGMVKSRRGMNRSPRNSLSTLAFQFSDEHRSQGIAEAFDQIVGVVLGRCGNKCRSSITNGETGFDHGFR